jgi:polar amino acid transport system substrate-binding protein
MPIPRVRLFRPVLHAALLLAALPALAADFSCPALTRVGISDLGYTAFQERGAYRGTAVDLVEELGRRTGCKFRLEWYPRERLFVQFANGRLDMAMGSLRDPERDRSGGWIPYTYTQFELLLTHASAGNFRSLAEFVDGSSGRLNVTRGISYPPPVQLQLERLQKLGRLEYVNDYEVVFKKIIAGRADGTLAPPIIHRLHQRRFRLEGKLTALTITEWPRRMAGAYLSNATVTRDAQRGFARAIYDMVADGTVQKIYERYLGAEVTHQMFIGGVTEILEAVPR